MEKMLLEVKQLETHFLGRDEPMRAVDQVSFHIREGEVLGLVGESGSGKSVSALSILGLVDAPGKVVGGEILFHRANGEVVDCAQADLETLRQIRGNEIAMIFQEPMTSLNPVYTIGNQIEEAVLVHGRVTKAEVKRRVLESLSRVRIPDPARIANSYPHELSGGMRQRAMIAMALSCRPRLLLVDEPTTALDVTVQAQILQLLENLRQELNMAMLFITHDLGVMAQIADRVAVMKEGHLVEEAEVKTLFAHPQHEYTQMLLSAVPRFTGAVQGVSS